MEDGEEEVCKGISGCRDREEREKDIIWLWVDNIVIGGCFLEKKMEV